MIEGRITDYDEATIDLTVQGRSHRRQTFKAIIDTGYNGFLTLPSRLIRELDLQFVRTSLAFLADDRKVELEVYMARVQWDDQELDVLVLETAGPPLVGMALLRGCRLQMDVVSDGPVRIESLPPSVM